MVSNEVRIKGMDMKHIKISSQELRHVKLEHVIVGCIYFFAAFLICSLVPSYYLRTTIYYSIVIIGAVTFASLAQNSKKEINFKLFMIISFSILFFNLGFRNFSGIDDKSYITIFNDVSRYGWLTKFNMSKIEPGYLLLNSIVNLFTNNYLYMQIVTSFIPLALFYNAFKRYRNIINIPIAVFLLSTMTYFQMLSASLVRMFIAMGIVINAYYYIPQKKYKKYTILIIIASMFHYSSLFMLILLYFSICKDGISKNKTKFIILCLIFIPFIFIFIAKVIVPLMGNRHISYSTIGRLKLSMSSFDTMPMILVVLFFSYNIEIRHNDHFKLFIVVFSLSSVFSFYSSMVSLGRMIFYANSALFILAPMVSRSLRGKFNSIIFDGIVLFYGFIYVYWTQFIFQSHIPNLYPYQNIFFTI